MYIVPYTTLYDVPCTRCYAQASACRAASNIPVELRTRGEDSRDAALRRSLDLSSDTASSTRESLARSHHAAGGHIQCTMYGVRCSRALYLVRVQGSRDLQTCSSCYEYVRCRLQLALAFLCTRGVRQMYDVDTV